MTLKETCPVCYRTIDGKALLWLNREGYESHTPTSSDRARSEQKAVPKLPCHMVDGGYLNRR